MSRSTISTFKLFEFEPEGGEYETIDFKELLGPQPEGIPTDTQRLQTIQMVRDKVNEIWKGSNVVYSNHAWDKGYCADV